MRAVAISALSSGQGKTMFTMALLHWLKAHYGSVRPYKVGPDYIDPRFHEKITGVESVNLDLYMASEDEVKGMFACYAEGKENLVIEGVMGYYDGIDYGTSTYEVAKTINIPVILLVSAEGSYANLIPTLKGMLDYRQDNTIKGIILNKVSSEKHYHVIEKHIKREIPELQILGWVQKGLNTLSSRHLGLDLNELDNDKLDELSESVMRHIDTEKLLEFMEFKGNLKAKTFYMDKSVEQVKDVCQKLKVAVINDKAFSFVYAQNLHFFDKYFGKVYRVSALNNEEIPSDVDLVYIPGGYVETPEVAYILDKADRFKNSLKTIAENPKKKIYAECAGLMFLGERIQTTDGGSINGSGILSLNFEIQKTRHRLGYYKAIDKDNLDIYKGHAFHYSKPVDIKENTLIKWGLFKDRDVKATVGGWSNKTGNVMGTYLHAFFFNQPELVLKFMTENNND